MSLTLGALEDPTISSQKGNSVESPNSKKKEAIFLPESVLPVVT